MRTRSRGLAAAAVGAAAGATAPLCPYGADRRWEIEAAHEEQLSPAAAAQPHTRPGGFAHRATIACRGCSDDRCGGRGKRARSGYYSGAAARAVQAGGTASCRLGCCHRMASHSVNRSTDRCIRRAPRPHPAKVASQHTAGAIRQSGGLCSSVHGSEALEALTQEHRQRRVLL